MELIDIIIIALLAIGGVQGFRKGFIDQIASIAALLLGIWIATRFSGFTANLIIEKFKFNSEYISVISFCITFAAVVIGVHFVGMLVKKFAEMIALGLINRIAGLIVGVLLWGFIISVVFSITEKFNFISAETKEKSLLYEPVSKVAPKVFPYLKFNKIKEGINNITMPDDDEHKQKPVA